MKRKQPAKSKMKDAPAAKKNAMPAQKKPTTQAGGAVASNVEARKSGATRNAEKNEASRYTRFLTDEAEVFLHPQLLRTHVAQLAGLDIAKVMRPRPESNSIQRRILDFVSSGHSAHPIWKTYKEAQEVSRRLLGEMILGAEGSKVAHRVGSKEHDDAIAWRYAELNPTVAMTVPLFLEIVLKRLKSGDAEFFITLGESLAKGERNKRVSNLNTIGLKMAEYWVNPECPLWMMNNPAGSMMVSLLLKIEVSVDNYAKIIDRDNHVRFGRFPIRDVRISREREFLGFELSAWVKLEV
jgi:hypothetical protein